MSDERHRELIAQACKRYDIVPQDHEWAKDDDGQMVAKLGRWTVMDDDEDRGLYGDDEGELHASVVGAPEYNNERVKFYFTSDDVDVGTEVEPFEDIEPA